MSRALLILLAALLAAGCAGGSASTPRAAPGSTLDATLVDPDGDGVLEDGAGEALVERWDLAPAAPVARTLITFAQVSDVHLLDEESPLRVEAVDRVGGSASSASRPQEALTAQVLAAMQESLSRMDLDAVLVTGDLIDNAQSNELDWALRSLSGGEVRPDSGAPGYDGVQEVESADPFIYRPDLDAPRHPGLLEAAQRAFTARGLGVPWFPAISNHDILLQGLVRPDAVLGAVGTGSRKLVRPSGAALAAARGERIDRDLLEDLLARDRIGRFRAVPADPTRRPLDPGVVVARIAAAAGVPVPGGRLSYRRALGPDLDVIVLDTADRSGGARGLLPPVELRRLRAALSAGAGRVVVVSPTPLEDTVGGPEALALLDEAPGVIAVLSGDTHRNRVRPRRTPSGGYWLIRAPSLVDFPQQARAYRLVELTDGRVALDTWLVDHAGIAGAPGVDGLAGISRDLAFLDAQGGRPRGWAGGPDDRNVRLFLP